LERLRILLLLLQPCLRRVTTSIQETAESYTAVVLLLLLLGLAMSPEGSGSCGIVD
jgi:hypothetical protein